MTAGSFHQKSTFFFTISKHLWTDFWQIINILFSLKVFNQIFTFLWFLPESAITLEVQNGDLVILILFLYWATGEFSLLTFFRSITVDLWISYGHSFWSSGWPSCWRLIENWGCWLTSSACVKLIVVCFSFLTIDNWPKSWLCSGVFRMLKKWGWICGMGRVVLFKNQLCLGQW